MMANSVAKTEHSGPKNGGGYWGKRIDAKRQSNKARRVQSRNLEREDAQPPEH